LRCGRYIYIVAKHIVCGVILASLAATLRVHKNLLLTTTCVVRFIFLRCYLILRYNTFSRLLLF
jgi:hypothetical protein